jgi:hypothetical protein
MSKSFLSENLNEPEVVSEGSTTLTGYDLSNTGAESRHVGFKDGDAVSRMIVVPPGSHVNRSGLSVPYPGGLTVESLTGDGTLIANVDYESSPLRLIEDET